MERLWNALFLIAEEQWLRFGDFAPFAAGMRNDGAMVRVTEDLVHQGPTIAKRVQFLRGILVEQARAETIRASCVCYQIEFQKKIHHDFRRGIPCNLEAAAGESCTADLPYALFKIAVLGLRITRKLRLGNSVIRPVAKSTL